MTEFEQMKIRHDLNPSGSFALGQWQAFFSYILGRHVTRAETEQCLREEREYQQSRKGWDRGAD